MTHTKGTWKYNKEFSAVVVYTDHKIKAVADFGKVDSPETEANGYLIAAAPELLAALQEFILCGKNAGYNQELIELCRAAITLATKG